MVEAYFEGGNDQFESRAFDLFLEYRQQDPKVEAFRHSCENLLVAHSQAHGIGEDFWQLPEAKRKLAELLDLLDH